MLPSEIARRRLGPSVKAFTLILRPSFLAWLLLAMCCQTWTSGLIEPTVTVVVWLLAVCREEVRRRAKKAAMMTTRAMAAR